MIETFPIEITPFEEDRLIRVFLPPSYETETKSYPVLYAHDGQHVFAGDHSEGGVSLELDVLLVEMKAEFLVIAIDNKPSERKNEYCPWEYGAYSEKLTGKREIGGGKGKEYAKFVVEELKPFIDKKYRTLPDETAMFGISLGGLISTYIACSYPAVFKKIAVISSAFFRNQEEIKNILIQSDLSSIQRFYMDCGTNEALNETTINKGFLNSNEEIYEIINLKVPNTRFSIIEGAEHDYEFFKKRLPDILAFLE
ncbi:alpha/beta hydrolase [Mesobacillus zeae]|uniref:Alpha/beta hydrolase n=1 Tax=Mesobacillus zeae TaxID=1917180 RepID=A0A398B7D6_9BACI|nr:alpha/beta hydrolase-fold protein [Mesobacillus zeae]RID85875.1 alpha/beta hydrolase [Mesobacillus zeae]